MENFFYDDQLVNDLEHLLEILDHEDWELESLPEDWSLDCERMEKERIFTISLKHIMDSIEDERYSDSNSIEEYDKISSIISENIDFFNINQQMPQLWYPTGETFKITKQDLIKYINK